MLFFTFSFSGDYTKKSIILFRINVNGYEVFSEVIGGQPLLFQGVRGNVILLTDEQQNKKRCPYPVLCVILKDKNWLS